MKDTELHVFHRGPGAARTYNNFLTQNRNRILHTEVGADRVLVWCKPLIKDGNQVFLSGHFTGV